MASSVDKIALYTNYDSSPSWRVRIALAIKGIKYERIFYSFDKPVQKDYYKVNPLVQVPTMLVNEQVITQSLAIIDFLNERYPKPSLLPEDLIKRAKAREIAELINSGIQPDCNHFYRQYKDDLNEYKKQCRIVIERGFGAVEKILLTTAGKFAIDDMVTIADVCLVPQVYQAKRYECDLTQFPTICKIWENLKDVEAFKTTHPDNEDDSPKSIS